MRIHNGHDCFVDFDDRDGETVHVIFSDAPRPRNIAPLWRDEVRKLGLSAIFVTAKTADALFQDALPIVAFHCRRFRQVASYGVGIGAEAAIRSASDLQAASTLAFSPKWRGDGLPPQARNLYVVFDRKYAASAGAVKKIEPAVQKSFNLSFTGANSSQFLSEIGKTHLVFAHRGRPDAIGTAVRDIGNTFDREGVFASSTILNKALSLKEDARREYLRTALADRSAVVFGDLSAAYLHNLIAKVDPTEADIEYLLYCQKVKNRATIAESSQHLATALSLQPENAYWHFQYGVLLARLRRWAEAIDAFKSAIDIGGKQPQYAHMIAGWHYELAKAYTKVWDTPNSVTSYKAWMDLNPYTRRADHLVKSADTHQAVRFVEDVLPLVKQRSVISMHRFSDVVSPSFVYWAQGIDENTPAIVRNAVASTMKHVENAVFLDDAMIPNYVEIPGYLWDLSRSGKMSKTHFSDVLRNCLLSTYGGAWIDATCFCTPSVNAFLADLAKHDFFAFSAEGKNKARISNWFLTSKKDGYIVNHMRESLFEYWRTFDYLDDYFLYHHIFRTLYLTDFGFRQTWDGVPSIPNQKAYTLIKRNDLDFDPQEFEQIVEGSPLHKMTYKFRQVMPGSFLEHAITNCVDGDLTSVTPS